MSVVPSVYLQHLTKKNRTTKEYLEIFSSFDAIIVTQHLRVCYPLWIEQSLSDALKQFRGILGLILQDEYDNTETTRRWIEDHSVSLVYTCIPAEHVNKVYPENRFPKTKFRSVLTGYIPIRFEDEYHSISLKHRKYNVVYRGRKSPQRYGKLAQQKETIGRVVGSFCEKHRIPVNIQWSEQDRIYGLEWYEFLQSGKATLGTESGANIFDEFGKIKEYFYFYDSADNIPPDLNFYEENLGFKMNQISPKIFESIGLQTALILYPGKYSGVIEEDHYLTMLHDHSNIEDVLDKLNNTVAIQKMVERTKNDILSSEKYSYRYFVSMFDTDLKDLGINSKNTIKFSNPIMASPFEDILSTGIALYMEREQKSGVKYFIIFYSRRYILDNYPKLGHFLRFLLGFLLRFLRRTRR